MSRVRPFVRVAAALAMVAIGVTHFTSPDGFVKIVPSFLPAPLALVYVSGAAEIAGGLGLLLKRTRRAASYGLIALYVAVFPANINMAVTDIQPAHSHIPEWLLWARLPFQFLFMALAWWLGRGDDMSEKNSDTKPEEKTEKDKGYGESHGYGPGHGGPSGPGDAPAPLDVPHKAPPKDPSENPNDDEPLP